MQNRRRIVLTAGAAAFALGCGRRPAAQGSEGGSWAPLDGALDHPGFRLWDPPLDRRAPLDAPLLTNEGAASLRQLMAGGPAVLSFWSPSCAPCLAEKPSLDVLAGRLAEAGVRVAVLSIFVPFANDTPTLQAAAESHQRLGLAHLSPIADATRHNSPFGAYIGAPSLPGSPKLPEGAFSLPCSTLIDPAGEELGRLINGVRRIPPADVAKNVVSFAETANWPTRDLWRDNQMFEFLRALGG